MPDKIMISTTDCTFYSEIIEVLSYNGTDVANRKANCVKEAGPFRGGQH